VSNNPLILRRSLKINRNIRWRDRYGKITWINKSKYNLRNRVKNTFFRYKQIIAPTLKARTLQAQRTEIQIGCKILNTMTALGMPQSSLRKQRLSCMGLVHPVKNELCTKAQNLPTKGPKVFKKSEQTRFDILSYCLARLELAHVS
jgi:hypothetical protein